MKIISITKSAAIVSARVCPSLTDIYNCYRVRSQDGVFVDLVNSPPPNLIQGVRTSDEARIALATKAAPIPTDAERVSAGLAPGRHSRQQLEAARRRLARDLDRGDDVVAEVAAPSQWSIVWDSTCSLNMIRVVRAI